MSDAEWTTTVFNGRVVDRASWHGSAPKRDFTILNSVVSEPFFNMSGEEPLSLWKNGKT